MTNPNDQTLWDKLQQAGLVKGAIPATVIEHQPWYLRVLQGFTGWMAAWFLLGAFFAIFHNFLRQEATALILGIALITAAFQLFRSRTGEFMAQFALALSLTGQCLCIYSWHELLDGSAGWWLTALMAGSLSWLMPSYIHRFLSAYMAIFALTIACIRFPVIWLMPSLVMVSVAALWLTEARWLAQGERFRAIAYALTLASLQMHGITMLSYDDIMQAAHSRRLAGHFWLVQYNEILLGTVLVVTIAQLLKRYHISMFSPRGLAAVGCGVVLALISQQATGLAVAWTLILLGFANGHRVLLGIGIFAFWAYLARYYYVLHMTLLDKSYLLMATGLLLLAVRWGWKKYAMEQSHA